MDQKQKRIRQKEWQDQAEEQERIYIRKWDQTDSPEIPDTWETYEIPGAPFWGSTVEDLANLGELFVSLLNV